MLDYSAETHFQIGLKAGPALAPAAVCRGGFRPSRDIRATPKQTSTIAGADIAPDRAAFLARLSLRGTRAMLAVRGWGIELRMTPEEDRAAIEQLAKCCASTPWHIPGTRKSQSVSISARQPWLMRV